MMMFAVLVIFLLFVLMIGLLVFYFQTQHSLRTITHRVDQLQPHVMLRSPNAIRLERAGHQDCLVLMEADLNQSPREALSENEMAMVDQARDGIKLSNEELKRNGEWIGIPFDHEWTEFLVRLPTLKGHYARAVAKSSKNSVDK